MGAPDYIVDIVVESSNAGHFVVLKANGHEIERAKYESKDEAMKWGEFYADYAKKSVAANGQSANREET